MPTEDTVLAIVNEFTTSLRARNIPYSVTIDCGCVNIGDGFFDLRNTTFFNVHTELAIEFKDFLLTKGFWLLPGQV